MDKKSLNLDSLQEWLSKPWGYGSLTLLAGFLAWTIQNSPAEEKTMVKLAFETADTYIPEGKSLIPIEITNYESLDSIIGRFGVVDLHTTPLNKEDKSRAIAFAVKILRAPNNPSHFAVLVDKNRVQKILSYSGPYSVSVRNPKTSGTQFVKTKKHKPRSRIFYDSD